MRERKQEYVRAAFSFKFKKNYHRIIPHRLINKNKFILESKLYLLPFYNKDYDVGPVVNELLFLGFEIQYCLVLSQELCIGFSRLM